MQPNCFLVAFCSFLSVVPGPMVGKRTVLTAVDHRGCHGPELGIANQFLFVGTRIPKATDFAAMCAVAQFRTFVDVVYLQFKACPVTLEVSAPTQAQLLHRSLHATLMREGTAQDGAFSLLAGNVLKHAVVIIGSEFDVGHRSDRCLNGIPEEYFALIHL